MTESSESVWYCLACGAENSSDYRFCHGCGENLEESPRQRLLGAAYFLNELDALRDDGSIDESVYERLRSRYRLTLSELGPRVAPRRAGATPRRTAPKREGPGWLAVQQANLLLYLGAFLVVIATLIFVSSGPDVSDQLKMTLLVLGTASFLAVGLVCSRISRVQQAGLAFFAVGALMVPLNFVGVYAFFFQDEDIDPRGLWLAASLTSALFYGAVSTLGLGRWYPVPMVIAMLSSLSAVLVISNAPPEAYAPSYVALAGLLLLPSIVPLRRAKEAFGPVPLLAANVVVPFAVLSAFSLTGFEGDRDYEVVTRWHLPATVALAALFYWAQALRPERIITQPALTIIALSVTAGLATTVVYALNVGAQWYGPAVAIVGLLYAGASERFGPPWVGRKYLGWLGLGLVTASWLLFEGLYGDFSRHGAGVHFAAAVFYLAAARVVVPEVRLFATNASSEGAQASPQPVTIPAAAMLVYAEAFTGGLGYYFLLSSLPAAETAEASDLSIAFFGLSLGVAAVAATMRWWWRDMRVHFYAIALGMSLFALLASVDAEGQVLVFLAVYTGVGLALALWERQALSLSIPAAFGFFALLALWRHYEFDDAYLPLVLSGVGYGLFAVHAVVRDREREWALPTLGIAFAFAAAAPIVGWVRLAVLADDALIDTEPFEETLLYQTATASVLLLGLLFAAQSWLARRVEFAAVASAVLMLALLLEIGHFRPDNVQAYTAPLGAYVLTGALVLVRVRALPADLRTLLPQLEVLGAGLIMGPTLVQSFDGDAWGYGLLLLGESLAFVGLGLVQRRLWLLSTSVSFVVLNAIHYLFLSGGPGLPNWAILAIAGVTVMAAGTAILLGRERWTEWQRVMQVWWDREGPASEAE